MAGRPRPHRNRDAPGRCMIRSASVGLSTNSSTRAMGILAFFNGLDGRNARMVEFGKNLGFALEPVESIRSSRKRLGQIG